MLCWFNALLCAAGGSATIEMSFSANPFFSNNTLRRCLGDDEAGVKEVTTDIQWKDNAHKLTVKVGSAAHACKGGQAGSALKLAALAGRCLSRVSRG